MAGLLLSALLLAELAVSSTLPPKRDVLAAPGVLKLAITAVETQHKPLAKVISKRQIVNPLFNDQGGLEYLINIGVGTPSQNVTCVLDTGSSETWVNPNCAYGSRPQLCNTFSRYEPKNSTSAKALGTRLTIQYGSGYAVGDYYTDTILLAGKRVQGQQFGVATDTEGLDTGLMGIGWGSLYSSNFGGTKYSNIIDSLSTQNVTQSRAFSLDLGNVDTQDSSVIFGGIDTKKFIGTLEKVPVIPAESAPDKFARYWVNMSSLGATNATGSKTVFTGAQPVFLDSGGTLSQLPTTIVQPLLEFFPGAEDVGGGLYTVPCSFLNATGSVDFGFGKTVVRVPYHQFVWYAQPEKLCVFGIVELPAQETTFVLGDTFLRSAFVVYDQDNANLHIAQSANCGTNLVAIGKGPDAVKSVVGDCPAPAAAKHRRQQRI